jgi:hypothetical protein
LCKCRRFTHRASRDAGRPAMLPLIVGIPLRVEFDTATPGPRDRSGNSIFTSVYMSGGADAWRCTR